MTVKERLHHAIEAMSDDEARAALRTLADASGDPVAWMLDHAPLDDEPETDEERQAVAEARADRERGIKPGRVRFLRDGGQLVITVVRVLPRGRAYDL